MCIHALLLAIYAPVLNALLLPIVDFIFPLKLSIHRVQITKHYEIRSQIPRFVLIDSCKNILKLIRMLDQVDQL